MIKKYIKTWYILTRYSAQIAFQSRLGALLFLLGKILRFLFFLFLIIFIAQRTNAIGGYSLWQIVFFFATYNLIDTITQFLFREVYRFRGYILNGSFDFILAKPLSPLFRSLFGGSDSLDLPLFVLYIVLVFISANNLGTINLFNGFLYIILVVNAFLISLSFHIFVLSTGVLTTEVDNTIMLYRDISAMARFPVDIYAEPLRGLLTFIIPIGIMMTFPAKAFMGLLSMQLIFISFAIGLLLFYLSLKFWQFSLKKYSSASS